MTEKAASQIEFSGWFDEERQRAASIKTPELSRMVVHNLHSRAVEGNSILELVSEALDGLDFSTDTDKSRAMLVGLEAVLQRQNDDLASLGGYVESLVERLRAMG